MGSTVSGLRVLAIAKPDASLLPWFERPMVARMARRTFVVVDITEIYVHWYAGRSKSEVAASLGVDRKTIRKYLVPAEESGITPGGPPMSEADWAKRIKSGSPSSPTGGCGRSPGPTSTSTGTTSRTCWGR